jgi:hypothetical protein
MENYYVWSNILSGELNVSISEAFVSNLNLLADKPTNKVQRWLGLDSRGIWYKSDSGGFS